MRGPLLDLKQERGCESLEVSSVAGAVEKE